MPMLAMTQFRNPRLEKEAAELLAVCRAAARNGQNFVKLSSQLGGDPEESFEQAFASLGFTHIKDKAPKLMDSLLGFQLVDRNNDNTKAMGVFGFNINKQMVYAPVFFMNGQIKGNELLYLVKQDLFVPLKENWVNYLMSQSPQSIGGPSTQRLRQLGGLQPDLRSLAFPPIFRKSSGVTGTLDDYASWLQPGMPKIAKLMLEPAEIRLGGGTLVPEMCANSYPAALAVKSACDQYPAIRYLCDKHYGQGWLEHSVRRLFNKVAQQEKLANKRPSILESYEEPSRSVALAGDDVVTRKAGTVKIVTAMTISDSSEYMTDEDKRNLMQHGYVVHDTRNEDEVAAVYNVTRKMEMVTPDESGPYSVLVSPGEFRDMFVLLNPHTSAGRRNGAVLVDLKGAKHWLIADPKGLWVEPQKDTREKRESFIDGVTSAEDRRMREGQTYVIVNVDGQGTLHGSFPFSVEESMGQGKYRVRWHYENHLRDMCPLSADKSDPDNVENGFIPRAFVGSADIVVISDREGTRFQAVRGMLVVPKGAKIVKVPGCKEVTHGSGLNKYTTTEDWHSDKAPAGPGDWSELQLMIGNKTASLRIWSNGDEVSINNAPATTKKQALFDLICKHGFRQGDAHSAIVESEIAFRRGEPAMFAVKMAGPSPMLATGVSAPAIPEPYYGSSPGYMAAQTMEPQEYHLPVEGLSAQLTDRSIYDPNQDPMIPQQNLQLAQNSPPDQKEVFDTSMFSGLLRAARHNATPGQMLKTLDLLGRELFKLYWHNDDYADRYGKADLPELEDSLRNNFDDLGDLILFLKEKDVDPSLGSAVAEPDVEESARD